MLDPIECSLPSDFEKLRTTILEMIGNIIIQGYLLAWDLIANIVDATALVSGGYVVYVVLH